MERKGGRHSGAVEDCGLMLVGETAATRLLGKLRAQPLLYVVLRERPLLFGVFQAVAYLD